MVNGSMVILYLLLLFYLSIFYLLSSIFYLLSFHSPLSTINYHYQLSIINYHTSLSTNLFSAIQQRLHAERSHLLLYAEDLRHRSLKWFRFHVSVITGSIPYIGIYWKKAAFRMYFQIRFSGNRPSNQGHTVPDDMQDHVLPDPIITPFISRVFLGWVFLALSG